jgi:hypothetical protein
MSHRPGQDTGEETVHPLLETPYMKWLVNNLGYTVLATFSHPKAALPPGPWRLLVYSDSK